MNRNVTWPRLAAVGLVAAALLTACSSQSSSESTSSTAAAATTAASAATGTAPSAAGSASAPAGGLEQAAADLAAYANAPTDIGITEPLTAKPTGKTVYYMECGAPLCAAIGKSMEAPAKLLGVNLVRVNTGLTADQVAAAWDKAAAASPDAVIGTGTGPDLYKEQLASLTSKGVPYVAFGFPDCDALRDPCPGDPSGVTVNLYGETDVAEYGKLMADWVATDSQGTGKSAWFYIPDFPLHKGMIDEYGKQLAAVCPDCSVDVQTSKITDIGTGIPTQVVNYVRSNPDVKYLLLGFGDMVTGVPEALEAAGVADQVKILTQASGPQNFQYIKNGQVQVADFPVAWDLAAWRALDIVSRSMAGQSLDSNNYPLPRQILTKDQMTFDTKGFWPGVPSFEQDYKKLWGVS